MTGLGGRRVWSRRAKQGQQRTVELLSLLFFVHTCLGIFQGFVGVLRGPLRVQGPAWLSGPRVRSPIPSCLVRLSARTLCGLVWSPGLAGEMRRKTVQQSVPTQLTPRDTEAQKGTEGAPSASCRVPGGRHHFALGCWSQEPGSQPASACPAWGASCCPRPRDFPIPCFSPPPAPPPRPRPPARRPWGGCGRILPHPGFLHRNISLGFYWIMGLIFLNLEPHYGRILCPLPPMFPSCLKFLRDCP